MGVPKVWLGDRDEEINRGTKEAPHQQRTGMLVMVRLEDPEMISVPDSEAYSSLKLCRRTGNRGSLQSKEGASHPHPKRRLKRAKPPISTENVPGLPRLYPAGTCKVKIL